MFFNESSNRCLGYRISEGFVGFKRYSNEPKGKNCYSVREKPKKVFQVIEGFTPGNPLPEHLEPIVKILEQNFFDKVYDLSSPKKRSEVANRVQSALLNVQIKK